MPPKMTRGRKRKLGNEEVKTDSNSNKENKVAIKSESASMTATERNVNANGDAIHSESAPIEESSKVIANESSSSSNDSRPHYHWLFKSEPESRYENGVDVKFGFEDLKNEPERTACWDGVRNYQARNFMRDQMRVGDKAFFYHR